MKQIVITGASGYIGRYLLAGARARGWRAIAATRRRPAHGDADWIPYALEGEALASSFPEAAVLVHLAANTAVSNDADERLAVLAAQRLLAIARERGLRFIFVSSQTARPNAPTAYGRAKWRIEQDVRAGGGSIVRPGLVYGGVPGGVFGQLCLVVRRSPFLPALIPSPGVQPIHVKDLAEGILRIAERDDLPPRAYDLADPKPIPFTCVLRTIASARLRRRRVFVPTPVAVVGFVLRNANRWIGSAFDAERFRSLTDLPLISTADDLEELALALRPLLSGMHATGSDRRRARGPSRQRISLPGVDRAARQQKPSVCRGRTGARLAARRGDAACRGIARGRAPVPAIGQVRKHWRRIAGCLCPRCRSAGARGALSLHPDAWPRRRSAT